MVTTVMNLNTGADSIYTCPPAEAVIAAYAQSLGDWNTWDYQKRYGHMLIRADSRVISGRVIVSCGDFAAIERA